MLLALTMMMLLPEDVKPDCGGNTLEMNACMAEKLDKSQKRLDEYLEKTRERYSDENQAAIRLGIEASQKAFEAYREIECRTVYEDWKGGTIRTVMGLGCQLTLTDERTHTVWENWLRYADSTPPMLPEPEPAE